MIVAKQKVRTITLFFLIILMVMTCDLNPEIKKDKKQESKDTFLIHDIKHSETKFGIYISKIPAKAGFYSGDKENEQKKSKQNYIRLISHQFFSYLIDHLEIPISISENEFNDKYSDIPLCKQSINMAIPKMFYGAVLKWFSEKAILKSRKQYEHVRVLMNPKNQTYTYQFFRPGGAKMIEIGPVANGEEITKSVVKDDKAVFFFFSPLSVKIYYGQENKGVQILNDPVGGIDITGSQYATNDTLIRAKKFFIKGKNIHRDDAVLNDLPKIKVEVEIMTSQTNKSAGLSKKERSHFKLEVDLDK